MASSKYRPVLVAAIGLLLEAAVTIPLGDRNIAVPELPAALAALVVALAALAGGLWPGLIAAVSGWILYFVSVADRAPRAWLVLPVWALLAIAAGWVGKRWRDEPLVREDLRVAEQRYRALAQGLPLVTWISKPNAWDSPLYVSPQVEAMLGYSPAEWQAEPELFARLLHPDDRERTLSALERTNDGAGAPLRSEYRLVARDGRIVWVRHDASTVKDAAGKPLYTQSFLLDIGDRKRADEERERLRGAERAAVSVNVAQQRRLDLLRNAGEILYSTLDARAQVRRVAELTVHDLADWCAVDLVEEGGELTQLAIARAESRNTQPAKADRAVRAVIGSGQALVIPPFGHAEEALGEKLEDALPAGAVTIVCAPIRSRGRLLGALTLARTEPGPRYGADELALAEDLAVRIGIAIDRARLHQEVEERADAARVLTYVADAVLLLDREGVVRLWNPAAEKITTIAAADVVGRAASEAIPGWHQAADSVPVSSSPDPGHPEVMIPIETEQGERWISISGVEFFGGTVYAFRDVTEVRHVEELKADFIATASHELRTPLAAVYGAAQTLLRHDFALDEAGRDRFVSLIAEESDRLGRIVNEILLANQLDAGRVDLGSEPFDPVELVDRVVEASRAYAPSGILLERRVPEQAPLVAADRDKVRQVLVNLIENAIKYSPDGGTIEVGLEAGPSEQGTAVFHVKDQGLGIPAEEQARIFEKFYRLDPQMTRGVGGTGLGLYICSELVDRMGGHIWVESVEGQGSTFLVELPAESPALARVIPGLARAGGPPESPR